VFICAIGGKKTPQASVALSKRSEENKKAGD
jgi:hypothetical protein